MRKVQMEDKVAVSVVMPAYNEEANIEKTVRACARALSTLGKKGEIVVTNDGSRDGTLEILKSLALEVPNLVVVNHQRNRGYGAALNSAIRASRGEYIVTIDSDGQFDIGELPYFFANSLNGSSVVTGYRKKKKDTLFRVLANRGLNSLIRVLFGANFNDINCAFRLFRGEALRAIYIESSGYQAPSEIILKMKSLGHNVKEIGVEHYAREGGRSALKPLKTIMETSAFLAYLRIKVFLYKRGMLNSL